MNKYLRLLRFFILAASLTWLPSCKHSEERSSSSPSDPKTSYGKAIKSAKDLNARSDEHSRAMDEQMDE